MTLAERHRQLIDDLSLIPDRHELLTAIVDRTRRHPPFSTVEKSEAHRVPGCQSAVWVIGQRNADGTLDLRCDADSPMVKGLIHLLCEAYTHATPAEIVTTEPAFLDELGLLRDLSPTRRNGLAAVRNRIKEIAHSALNASDSSPPGPS